MIESNLYSTILQKEDESLLDMKTDKKDFEPGHKYTLEEAYVKVGGMGKQSDLIIC